MTRDDWVASSTAKLARADEHLAALHREADGWGDGDPFAVERKSNAEGREHIFTLRFKTQPNVWRWAVLLGDALHNLRCALDHMVYALATAQTGKDPPDDDATLAFPIASDPSYFARSRFRIRSLDPDTQTAIEKAQPYNRLKPGKWFMPLWWLAQLHDIDKHRLSHISVVAAHPDDIAIDAPPGTFRAFWNEGPLIDGAPLLRVVLNEPNPGLKMKLEATGSVVLQFGDGIPPMSLYWTTRHIRREVGVVCRYLNGFFPS